LWYVGILRADGRTFRVRPVQTGGQPSEQIAVLATIWRHTFDRNTLAMAEALLSTDWLTITDAIESPRNELAAEGDDFVLVEGTGTAIRGAATADIIQGDVEVSEPNGANWMYLLDAVGRARLFLFSATPQWRLSASYRLQDIPPRSAS
jgi:hypothetical protein